MAVGRGKPKRIAEAKVAKPAKELTRLRAIVCTKRNARSVTGFTLVEVMVALMLLLVTVTGIYASFVASEQYVNRAKRRIAAVNYGRRIFEELKSCVRQDWWDELAPDLPSYSLYIPLNDDSKVYKNLPGEGRGEGFGFIFDVDREADASYTVSRLIGGVEVPFRKVTLKVSWSEPTVNP